MNKLIRGQRRSPLRRGIEGFHSRATGKGIPSTMRIARSDIKGETFRNVPGMSAGLWLEKNSK